MSPRDRWNHNIHYHRLVLNAVPEGSHTALDVGTGTGTGLLAADLRRRVPAQRSTAHREPARGRDVDLVAG
ncbi:hypothetical protein [Pseudonocardia autotrophica]|uniref:Uncharacterized protein n=1 Tax=Pseudonocardia autotrophica TaxID=2074 RepID=A0A1Y2MKU5_PSEAH|nr:hypothetical protein [Pseudonocardia autotrophica]OSY35896.1 hypothetical protein BG845_05733 [Pseudonocardia autotrophica]